MSDVDLEALRMESTPGSRRRGPGWIGWLLLVVALSVAATFLSPLVRPRVPVRTAPVVAVEGEQGRSMAAVEAAGWVEPEPWPTWVRPLVGGVLAEVLVLPGDAVTAGESVIARLDTTLLAAALQRATVAEQEAAASVALARVQLRAAEQLLEQRLDLRRAEHDASHEVEIVEERLRVAQAALKRAVAVREQAAAELSAMERLAAQGAVHDIALQRARVALRAADADVAVREEEMGVLLREQERDLAIRELTREALRDPRALSGAVEVARATLDAAQAGLERARVDREIAERELALADVTASATGVVLKVAAPPGSTVGPDEPPVAAIYDPARLQVRVDVPLASVAAIDVGQPAEVHSDRLGDRVLSGEVIRIERESDLLKNTQQVKVRLREPVGRLVPETLVRVRFLGRAVVDSAASPTTSFRVPRAALRDGFVLVIDPRDGGRARRVSVEVVGGDGDAVVVDGDLSRSQRVILDPDVVDGDLVDGVRVEEDAR